MSARLLLLLPLLAADEPPRRAVVQIWDVSQRWYASALLASNQGLREVGMVPRFEHAVLVAAHHNASCLVRGRCDAEGTDAGVAPTAAAAALRALGVRLLLERDVAPPLRRAARATPLATKVTKLALWRLTQYERVLFLDTDVVVMRDLARVTFDEEDARARRSLRGARPRRPRRPRARVRMAADPASGVCANSGVMLLTPNASDYAAMARALAPGSVEPVLSACSVADARRDAEHADAGAPEGDQSFLQWYFERDDRLAPLGALSNVLALVGHRGLRPHGVKWVQPGARAHSSPPRSPTRASASTCGRCTSHIPSPGRRCARPAVSSRPT